MPSQVMRHRRLAAMAAAAVAATTLVAACASGSQGGASSAQVGASGSQGGASADSDAAASGSPVKVMATGILATPAANFAESVNGAEAAADAINKTGGINGHPIQIITCNDNLNVNDAIACAREAIADHVIAYAGGVEPSDAAVFPYLERAQIPYVGPETLDPTAASSKFSFPLDGENNVMMAESGTLAVKMGGPRVVVFQLSDQPASISSAAYGLGAIKAAGGTVAKLIGAPIDTVNWSSYAAQAMNANPDGVTCSCSPENTPGLLKALRQAGFNGPITEATTAFLVSDIKSLGSLAGKVYLTGSMRSPDAASPDLQPYLDEMSATQPASALRDQTSEVSWLAVHVIADLLNGQQSLTSATLLKQLQTTKGINGHGLIPNGVNWLQPGPITQLPRVPTTNVIDYQWDGSKIVEIPPGFHVAVAK
jgi:ABC-type branched-subunit amino acid transport system substrate-binding protein